MSKKIFLLISLLTIPANTLLIAEDDMYATIENIYAPTNNKNITSGSSVMPLPLATPLQDVVPQSENPQENTLLLEQQFMCEQKAEEVGVICQMYECLNEDCYPATTIKTSDETITAPTQESLIEDTFSFDFDDDDDEILCPVVEKQKSSEPQEEEINDDLIIKKITSSEPEIDVISNDELSNDVLSNIDISPNKRQEIQQLKTEIWQAEKTCERAESDPREKAICEDASADVQWRKERIRKLINQ